MDIVNKGVSLKNILLNYRNPKDINFIRRTLIEILNDYFLITDIVSKYKFINEKLYFAFKVITSFYIRNNELIENKEKIFSKEELKYVIEFENFLIRNVEDVESYINNSEYPEILKYSLPQFYINETKKVIKDYDEYFRFIKEEEYKPAIRIIDEKSIEYLEDYGIKLIESKIPFVYFTKNKISPSLIFESNLKITFTDFSSLYSIYSLYEKIKELDKIKILDAFSAPGSKISYLYQLLKNSNKKFYIKAIDINEDRLKRMKYFMKLYNLNFDVEKKNFLSIDGKYDVILMDVPCTNSGTIWQNPDQRLKQNLNKMIKNVKNQRKFIEKVKILNPKYIYYATCSIFYWENEFNVKYILDKYKLVEADPLNLLKFNYGYRFFPHKHRTQGFFYSILER